MISLSNHQLQLTINPHGAELSKVYSPVYQTDYLWNADPRFWQRSAPVLFPIVGSVAQNTYFHQGKPYHLSQHGFARDMVFQVMSQTEQNVWFQLVSTPETLTKYPFPFVLRIGYELTDDTVSVHWEVENPGQLDMFFSIGAHPAFNANLNQSNSEQDAYDFLFFEESDQIHSFGFDNDKGLVHTDKVLIAERKTLPLDKELFTDHPTLIVEGERGISLCSTMHDREVQMTFDGFPYVGIWSPINDQDEIASFVCIEPWYGMADTHSEPGEISHKKGIQTLAPGQVFNATYTMSFR